MPEKGLRKVMVRQDKIFFNARLDAERRIIWVEGKPYKSTRAFTDKLLKFFPR